MKHCISRPVYGGSTYCQDIVYGGSTYCQDIVGSDASRTLHLDGYCSVHSVDSKAAVLHHHARLTDARGSITGTAFSQQQYQADRLCVPCALYTGDATWKFLLQHSTNYPLNFSEAQADRQSTFPSKSATYPL